MGGAHRLMRTPAPKKNQKTLVTERLAAIDARLAENEGRVAAWLAAAGQDIVTLRQMLGAAVEAMEAHDTTIAAMRAVISEHVPDGDEKIERKRKELVALKDAALRKNKEMADEWNRQLEQMAKEGMSREQIAEIFATSKRTMTAPEIVRMQLAQGEVDEVPAGAFEFSLS